MGFVLLEIIFFINKEKIPIMKNEFQDIQLKRNMGKELFFSKILSFLLLVLNGYCYGVFFLPNITIDSYFYKINRAIIKYFPNGRQREREVRSLKKQGISPALYILKWKK